MVPKIRTHYAQRLKRKQGRLGDIWYLDELFVRINGQQQYLWRAIDQDGDVIDILLQPAAISAQPSDSFASWCAVNTGSRSGSSPTNSRATVQRSEQSCQR